MKKQLMKFLDWYQANSRFYRQQNNDKIITDYFKTLSLKAQVATNAEPVAAPVSNQEHILPYRVGKNQNRAVLDAAGHEVVVFPKGREAEAQEYCNYKNGTDALSDLLIKITDQAAVIETLIEAKDLLSGQLGTIIASSQKDMREYEQCSIFGCTNKPCGVYGSRFCAAHTNNFNEKI